MKAIVGELLSHPDCCPLSALCVTVLTVRGGSFISIAQNLVVKLFKLSVLFS